MDETARQRGWRIIKMMFLALLSLFAAAFFFDIPLATLLIALIFTLWIGGALALWLRANAQANAKSAWWQDDKKWWR